MYKLESTAGFRKLYKKVSKHIKFNKVIFDEIVEKLLQGEELDTKYKNHKLKGGMYGMSECHLAPDLLLVYRIDDDVLTLTLVKIGSHSEIF